MNKEKNFATALLAATQAGEEIMRVYAADDFDVQIKSDNSPLTKADQLAHEVIIAALAKTGLPVLSEESNEKEYALRKEWDAFWLVDPLDGTKEFIKRNGEFTVNIALILDGKAEAGIVYVPVARMLYFGERGLAAYKMQLAGDTLPDDLYTAITNTKPIRVQLPKDRQLFIVGSRSHMTPETAEWIEQYSSDFTTEIVSKGSSLKLCLVAEGKAHLYPRFAPTMEWDTAAGHAIAIAAGAEVVDYHTKEELCYNKENLLNPWFLVQPLGGIGGAE